MSDRTKKILPVLIALAVGIAIGAVGYKDINHRLKKQKAAEVVKLGLYDRSAEMLRDAFVDPLAKNETLVNPACSSGLEMTRQVEEICSMPAEEFFEAYEKLSITNVEQVEPQRVKVSYELQKPYQAWTYLRKSESAESGKAFLIIPGSGFNESSKIFNADPQDYHGDIAAQAAKFGDAYVLVKPNEDFLAIHDGKKKLSYNYITFHLLNRGGSYSARYLVDSLAVVKALQKKYKQVYVVGLSQGGTAAIYNALQSKPTGAMIASGYSVLIEQSPCSGFNQIALPGISNRYSNEQIRSKIAQLPTKFVFSYGREERGLYRIEANEGDTQEYFGKLTNVKFLTHDGGHAFAAKGLDELLK